ncbi:YjbF family lipoprotein [Planktomarina temperata]|nr:YjbF family lipoprotein [Planktomarina temperata]
MIQENGPTRTYVSDDGIALLLQNGLLAGSRGFGDDLMSSDHAAAHRAILKGSGRYERVLRYINSQNHLEAVPLTCGLTDHGAQTITILGDKHRVIRRVEICDLAGRQIENTFWISGKTIWKSQQWVSDRVGSLTIEQVQ